MLLQSQVISLGLTLTQIVRWEAGTAFEMLLWAVVRVT